jgi:multiple sugar transport system ATP-binding protein
MEVTGESTLLHLDWQGFPVHVQVAGRIDARLQQPLNLTARREKIHLFDAASGRRLAEEN